MERLVRSSKEKALSLNLNPTVYGTLAEIGGGQEVARAFFQAGGASGTIAKSISAYDKTFSDSLYCPDTKLERYVSEDRLLRMLDKEYTELVSLLQNEREPSTRYFVFANTVEILNYHKTNEGQGWMGIRFQISPDSKPNDVILHVRLLENDGLLQQYTLGILGVNLIYGGYNYYQSPNEFLLSLFDNLANDRLEITMIRMTGPELCYIDNRLLSVQLVKNEMTPATIFDRYGKVQQPSDMLHKKNVLALRGSFRPMTYVGLDMLKTSYQVFKSETGFDKDETIMLCEITLNNLLEQGQFDEKDFLDRVDLLNAIGQNVLISSFREYYKLGAYFSRYKIKNLRVIIGVPTFAKVIDKSFYMHLKGGILEAFGRLFMNNLKLYIYPALDDHTGALVTSRDLELQPDIRLLYQYLVETGKIVDITGVNKQHLHIFSHQVLEMIKENQSGWEKLVPVYIAELIKSKQIFGFTGDYEPGSLRPKCHE